MKRLLVLFIATFLLIGLAACGDSKDTMSFDSFRNQKTGVTISLGMSQEKVEKLLGEAKDLSLTDAYKKVHENALYSDPNKYLSYGEGEDFIAITYKNDCITEISTSSIYADANAGQSNWGVKYGLTYGNTSDDVFKYYEKIEKKFLGPNGEDINISLLHYFYDASGKRVDAAEKASYYITFCMDDSKNIILICDIGKVGESF